MRAKAGDMVHVRFYDHCKCSGEDPGVITCEVFGRLIASDRLSITVACWLVEDMPLDSNTETFVLLRSAIRKIRRLK